MTGLLDGTGSGPGWSSWFDGLHSATRREGHVRWLVRAKQHADAGFRGDVRLDDMASTACLSKYHFIRAFRRIFRETPHRYVTQRRIARARELLERTALPVTEIAFEVGFASLGSSIGRFTGEVGESPSRYRRRFARGGAVDERPMPACLYEALTLGRDPPPRPPS